jgi:cytochrome c oxidase subunit 2
VHSNNPVGVQTNATIDSAIVRLQKTVDDIALQMANADAPKETAHIMTDAAYAKAKAKKERTQRHIKRLKDLKASMTPEIEKKAMDDKVIKLKEIHLIVNKDYELTFRSQDVIHSAYMPHFRLQMNTVPGMTTRFKFKPTITTDSMRTVVGNDKFDYILLCNKICGSAHYNMQMVVKVDTEEGYKKWYAEQKTFKQEIMPEAAPAEKTEEVAVADSSAVPADSVKITALK